MTELQPPARALFHLLGQRGRLQGPDVARLTELAGRGERPIHQLLEQEGIITEAALAALLAEALRLRLVDLADVPLDRDAAHGLGEHIAARHEVVPVKLQNGTLELATANPFDVDAVKAVEFVTGRRVRLVVATRSQILWALEHVYRGGEAAPPPMGDAAPPPTAPAEPVVACDTEPVATREPETLEVSEPELAEVREPEPVVACDRELVVAYEPEPVAVHEPEPVVTREAEPVTAPAPEPVVSDDRIAAAVAPLREQLAQLERRQREQAAAAARVASGAAGVQAAVQAELVRLGTELRRVESAFAETERPSAAVDDVAGEMERLRTRVEQVAPLLDGQRDAAAQALAVAAEARDRGDRALRRIEELMGPLRESVQALRATLGELQASQARAESTIARRLGDSERRAASAVASTMTSVSDSLEQLRCRVEAQDAAAGDTRLEVATARQRAAEAMRRVEALAADELRAVRASVDALAAELGRLEARVEQRCEVAIRSTADGLAGEMHDLRSELDALGARVPEPGQTVLGALWDRLAVLAAGPLAALRDLAG